MTTEEQEMVDKMIEEKMQEKKPETSAEIETTEENSSRELATTESQVPAGKIEMPNFVPQIDKTKDLSDQASDVVQIMGAQRASTNETFMNKVSEKFQHGVLTEQETKNMQRQRLLEEEYWLKWQDVLEFIFMKSPHGLLFMQIMTVVAMIIYIPTRLIGMIVKTIGLFGDFVNEIFNSIFGGKGKYLRDKDGNVIQDPKTKKPYIEKQGYNLFAKLLFGIIAVGLALALIFVFVKLFTGFDTFNWFRQVL